ncbi:hypothetical protein AB0N16_27985 [Streptomyces sp. NPDC051105]|uniref:hypothetical protein n=1 Tax=Streptomyces sp. NPDC051105 TaxID=3154843 RepID=UPI00344096D3
MTRTSHHMSDLRPKGLTTTTCCPVAAPTSSRELSGTGTNTLAGFGPMTAKQFLAVNPARLVASSTRCGRTVDPAAPARERHGPTTVRPTVSRCP